MSRFCFVFSENTKIDVALSPQELKQKTPVKCCYGSREVPSYKTNFEKSFYIFQIDLYLSNRFQFFKSAFQIGLYFSNRFLSFKWIYIIQIPRLNRFTFFKSHLCFLNRFKFFKPTLVTCFFFPKRLISSKSFSIFQSKIKIVLYISNQLNNF